ncbi:MAG TPA: tetratricopeptide repeat protein, partial [Sphingomonadales bacterium]|nr:tetratricopeptide repeat protein [Sphingomonadales bacterium]
MIRLAIYITLAILLAVGAVWFADHPGNMIITWQGWEIRLSVAVFGLLALLYTFFCWYLFRLYRWFRSENPLTSPKRQQSRRQKGLAELDKGWAALAVHDREAAIRHGKKALGLLPDNNGPRRLLVKATEGKIRQKYLDQLSKDPDGHLLAMACKLDIALSEGDTQGSLALLNDIREKRPNNPWISQQLFDIQTRLGQWTAAAQELTKLAKAKAIDKVTEKHLSAVLAYSQALEADLAGQKKLAREQAELAL